MPDSFPPPLDDATLASHFPIARGDLPTGMFELGITLGGTVSAGAYTAGVLDYLIEALDAWSVAKTAPDRAADVPMHTVFVSTIAGTSGGAINGAIALRALGFGFPHGPVDGNPFFRAWVEGLTLRELLSTDSATDPGPDVMSLLNCGALEAKVAQVLGYTGPALGANGSPARRGWLADPLRLAMMLGNITGVPYRIGMNGATSFDHEMIAHADHVRFALAIGGGTRVYAADGAPSLGLDLLRRGDEFALSTTGPENWDRLGEAALATSAFPLAFRSRAVRRPLDFLSYRVAVLTGPDGKPAVRQLPPIWDRLRQDTARGMTTSVNVDGGTLNNEPLDMTRTALAGLGGRNPRDGALARRAVLLIDPFSDPEKLGPDTPPAAGGLIGPVLNELIQQSRFKPEDVALAADPNTFSRFLIAPVRRDAASGADIKGSAAIASGGLGGFLGFLCRDFLVHDFMLGRANAYGFLQAHFTFPGSHPIVRGWTDAQRRAQLVPGTPGKPARYRMIPLMAHLRAAPPPRPGTWPAQAAMPDWLNGAIDQRLDLLKDRILPGELPDKWLRRQAVNNAVTLFWKLGGRGYVRGKMVAALRQAMIAQKLLPSPG